jgi:hypothetical protein
MEAAGLRPDVVTYTALMALVVKTGPYRGRSSPAQRYALSRFPVFNRIIVETSVKILLAIFTRTRF